MKSFLKIVSDKIKKYFYSEIKRDNEIEKLLLAKILIEKNNNKKNINSLTEIEFKVFSQFGEDGIIQYLINIIPIKNKVFIEFGVQDYQESNTRFLLMNNNWEGLIIDSNKRHIEFIKNDEIYWKYNIKAVCEFITRENMNDIFRLNGFEGDIGLLSIDIDGNDYWVWDAITIISPRIVICEYNSVFGYRHAVTIPYVADFNRTKAHYSNLYFGASLPALCFLARKKGYIFVGSNSTGSNAFFVRKDLANSIINVVPEKGYVCSKFRESRDSTGQLTYISGENRSQLIEDLEVYDVITGYKRKIKEFA